MFIADSHRRQFLARAAATAGLAFVPGAWAEALTLTPRQTEGPFYPNPMPLDTDNDLLIVNDRITPAVGTVMHLSGRVLTANGSPLRNATVEIWQVDNQGIYLHKRCQGFENRDANFQSYGRFLTDVKGRFYFRTIKPVQYSDRSFVRTPHVHVIVKRGDKRLITTQLYLKGHPLNTKDGIYRGIRDLKARDSVTMTLSPVPGVATGEVSANADLIVGFTPED